MKLFGRGPKEVDGDTVAQSFSAPPPGNPVEVGLALRVARESRGISLEQARNATGVPRVDLEALEQGNLELLHVEQAAVVGLWRYSELLGLDPGPLVGVIRAFWPRKSLAVDALYSEAGGSGMPVARLSLGNVILERIVPKGRSLMQGTLALGLSDRTLTQLETGSAHNLLEVAVVGPVQKLNRGSQASLPRGPETARPASLEPGSSSRPPVPGAVIGEPMTADREAPAPSPPSPSALAPNPASTIPQMPPTETRPPGSPATSPTTPLAPTAPVGAPIDPIRSAPTVPAGAPPPPPVVPDSPAPTAPVPPIASTRPVAPDVPGPTAPVPTAPVPPAPTIPAGGNPGPSTDPAGAVASPSAPTVPPGATPRSPTAPTGPAPAPTEPSGPAVPSGPTVTNAPAAMAAPDPVSHRRPGSLWRAENDPPPPYLDPPPVPLSTDPEIEKAQEHRSRRWSSQLAHVVAERLGLESDEDQPDSDASSADPTLRQ